MSETATKKNSVYVDYAGSSIYSQELIQTIMSDFLSNTYANPHSQSESGILTSNLVEQTRNEVLEFLNTNSDEYAVVFTSGCTAALKLLSETFSFVEGSANPSTEPGCFCYLLDNHTSVLGMREVAAEKNALVVCLSADQLYQTDVSDCYLRPDRAGDRRGNSMFVFPAQSNFSGHRYPLEWIDMSKSKRFPFQRHFQNSSWFVCLDAASYVSTSPLDLGTIKPDFVTLSFYKIFGYPTGLGALLVNQKSKNVLKKNYFGGGTVEVTTPRDTFHQKRSNFHEAFEDGTLPFLEIISLHHCFKSLNKIFGGISSISEQSFKVAHLFYAELSSLKHKNGKAVARIYSQTNFEESSRQGPIVTFNILNQRQEFVGYSLVSKMAAAHNIHLRVGCFCNIGACQIHLGITTEQLLQNFQTGHVCGDEIDLIDGQPTGAVRISFGSASTDSDATECIRFIRRCFIDNHTNELSTSLSPFPFEGSTESNKTPFSSSLSPGLTNAVAVQERQSSIGTNRRILTDLFVYPIKSCAPMKVKKWPIVFSGLLHDREWMVCNDRGIVVTQKTLPRLCLIQPLIDLTNRVLILKYPG